MRTRVMKSLKFACCLLAFGFVSEGVFTLDVLTSEVQARVGRPLTPVSVAGVARRTTRRTIRRTAVYVATLPPACRVVVVEGMSLHQCGNTYYQAYNKQYVVVEVSG